MWLQVLFLFNDAFMSPVQGTRIRRKRRSKWHTEIKMINMCRKHLHKADHQALHRRETDYTGLHSAVHPRPIMSRWLYPTHDPVLRHRTIRNWLHQAKQEGSTVNKLFSVGPVRYSAKGSTVMISSIFGDFPYYFPACWSWLVFTDV